MKKSSRFEKILSLINEYEIDTQEELTERLNQLGFDVSQATISRDINELGLIKTGGLIKKSKYTSIIKTYNKIDESSTTIIKNLIVSISRSMNIVVIKTKSGNANAVANILDHMNIPNALGSVAGDDTILIVVKSENDGELIIKIIKDIINA